MTQTNARYAALLVLQDVLFPKKNVFHTLDQAFSYHRIFLHKEHKLIYELCFGTCRHFNQLHDWALELLDKPLKQSDQDIFLAILLGIYQLYFLNAPHYSSINESVNLAIQLKKPWAKGLINAILRRAQREETSFKPFLEKQPSSFWAHEEWFIQKIQKDWPTYWQEILSANNQKAPLVIRVNTKKISRDSYIKELDNNQISYSISSLSNAGIYIYNATLSQLPYFEDGFLSVQDESAQMAAYFLDVKPHMRVLDACSAPGNKTCHLLETYENFSLVSIERDEKRSRKIIENLNRLGFKSEDLSLFVQDVVQVDQWWDKNLFDRILVDAPCSSTGVIRRHPDIKWSKNESDLRQNAKIQLEILRALWPTLKVGGVLVYSTCSIFKIENEEVIAAFIADKKNYLFQEVSLQGGVALSYGYQFLPHPEKTDGFYYSIIQKTDE